MRVRSDRLLRSAGVVGTVPSESMQLTFSKSPSATVFIVRVAVEWHHHVSACRDQWLRGRYTFCVSIQLTLIATDELDNFNRY